MAREGAAAGGVIHDLGYRRYDGPRLGRRHVWQSLFDESLKGAYGLGRAARSKVVPLLCLAALTVPVVVMVAVVAIFEQGVLPVDYTEYLLNLQPLIAVFVAAQAPATVSRDLRFGVVPLYLSRPMRRADYVSARVAGFSAAVFLLLATPLTVLFAGAMLAELPLGEQLPEYLRGLVLAALLAVVLAGIGLLIAAATPRRGLGVAAIVAVLLVLAGVQVAAQNIAAHEAAVDVVGWTRLISPFTLVDGVVGELLGTADPRVVGPPGTAGTVVFVAVLLTLVGVCWTLLVRRYRKVGL